MDIKTHPKAIAYKIATLNPETGSTKLYLEYRSKTGVLMWVDKNGADFSRERLQDDKGKDIEQCGLILLDQSEAFKYRGNNERRAFKSLVYLPLEEEGSIVSPQQKAENILYRKAHSFIKEHPMVKVKDENGNNCNPNQQSLVMFELIEETKDVLAQVAATELKTTYSAYVMDMYKNRRGEFMELCYALNIHGVETTPIEVLFTEVSAKIQGNPNHFKAIFDHENRELVALINKAKFFTTVTGNLLISQKGDSFYLDEEIIGKNDNEVLHYFDTKPAKRQYLMLSMGIVKDEIPEPVKLANTDAAEPLTKHQQSFKQTIDAGRNDAMVRSIGRKIEKHKQQVAKADKSVKGELEREFNEELKELRTKYMDIPDLFDDYVAKKMA